MRPADGGQHVDLLYTVVGKGTEILAKKEPSSKVGYMGPLGVGFLQHSFDRHGRPVRQLQHPADPSVRARAARTRTLGLKISFPR